jgi:hypothetical protein
MKDCPVCRGTGREISNAMLCCKTCGGTGKVFHCRCGAYLYDPGEHMNGIVCSTCGETYYLRAPKVESIPGVIEVTPVEFVATTVKPFTTLTQKDFKSFCREVYNDDSTFHRSSWRQLKFRIKQWFW